jgi:PKD repeat protein
MKYARRLAAIVKQVTIGAALAVVVTPHATAEPSDSPRDGSARPAGRWADTDAPAGASIAPPAGGWSLPLAFEENLGQTDASVRYLARGTGYALYLTDREAVLALRRTGVRNDTLTMRLVGSNRAPRIRGEERLSGVSNYFVGNDPTKWRTGVAHHGRVCYERVYPGVDLVFYGRDGRLEYDFVVAPGADPGIIQLEYAGASSIRVDGNGDLVLVLDHGEVRHHAPLVYQDVDGERRKVPGRFVLGKRDRVGFELGDYDRRTPLVVDPVLSYSTYLGGSASDYLEDMALYSDGSVVLVGATSSTNFPLAGSPLHTSLSGSSDAWISRLSASGAELVYSTYLGGSGGERAKAVGLDADGNAYITGDTDSSDFPVAGAPYQGTPPGNFDVFVAKLSPTGSALVYSTYLGGSLDSDGANAIAVAPGGEVVVAGHTVSDDFPIAGSPVQPTRHGVWDGFVTRLNASGSALVFSTFLGGSEYDSVRDLVLGGDGSVDVVGSTSSPDFSTAGSPVQGALGGESDAFVLRLSAMGGALLYSTYLGGSADDYAHAMERDPTGRLLVAGETASVDFPTVGTAIQGEFGGGTDGFVAELDLTAGSLVYSTYLGGSGYDWASGMAVDATGSAHVTGVTASNDFPIAGTPVQGVYGGGSHDAFLSTIDPAGLALTFSSFLGGGDYDDGAAVAVDGSGNLVLAGRTKSTDFPLVGTPFQGAIAGSIDVFVARIATSSGAEPVAGFTWSPSAPDVGQAVQFTDTSTGNPTSWSWVFGDGQTDTTQNPVHVYSSAGAMTVTLTVSNQVGSGSRSQTIGVGCDPIAGAPALTIAAVGSGIVRLTWTAVEGATGYRLYRSAWPATSIPIAEGEDRTYTDLQVEPQTMYCYYVETYNLCGNGPVSGSECVTTPVALPEEAWVPVASRAGGAAGSTWRTDLALLNPWDYPSDYELRFRRDGQLTFAEGSLAAWGQEILTDVVHQLGDSGSGTLEVRSLRPLTVSSRTYNQSSSGTFGQNLPGYRVAEGLAAGWSAYLPQLTENAAFRSNILLSNMSKQQAVAVVELHNGAGVVLAEYTVTLAPGQWRQENRPFFTKAGEDDLAAGYARVRVTAGSGVVALASVVDNLTNDPTTQAMVVAPQGTAWRWVPVASHAAGAHGSEWRTDLGVLNTGGQAASFKLRFLTGGEEWSTDETVAAGDQLILVDIVGRLGAAGSGALAVEAGPGVIVSSRTYNQSSSGTFGQNLPGYEAGDGLGNGSSGLLPQLTENAAFRSNILLTNTGPAPAVANVYLFDGAGTELASYVAELEPGEQSQKNRPFFALAGQSDLASGYAMVHVTVGSGVVACASVVDNLTNDPTTILMAK